jgi:hypothetical protein
MDVEALSLPDMRRILTTLEVINRWLGGVHATLTHLRRFSKRWKPGEKIRIVDWGTGGADVPRAIVDWARRRRRPIEIIGVDNNPDVIHVAGERCRGYPEIQLVKAHVFAYSDRRAFDYAISSLCLHHLNDGTIVELLRKSHEMVRRGIIMNDLIRSRRAHAWIWALTRLLRAHPVVRDDAPHSVQRAFTAEELAGYAAAARVSYLRVETFFGYRQTLAGEKE